MKAINYSPSGPAGWHSMFSLTVDPTLGITNKSAYVRWNLLKIRSLGLRGFLIFAFGMKYWNFLSFLCSPASPIEFVRECLLFWTKMSHYGSLGLPCLPLLLLLHVFTINPIPCSVFPTLNPSTVIYSTSQGIIIIHYEFLQTWEC